MVRDATLVADPFHVTKLANTKARRVPTPGAERDPRSSGPQVRSPLSLPAPVDQGQGAARRQRPREAHRPPSCRRSPRRCGHPLAGQGGRASSMHTPIPTSPSSGSPSNDLVDEDSGSRPARSDEPCSAGSTGLPPGTSPRLQRTDRGDQELHQAGRARRVRVHVVPGLPDLLPRCPGPGFPPGDTTNAAEMCCRDPPDTKSQEATGFSQRSGWGCTRRNMVVTSALASGHGLGG